MLRIVQSTSADRAKSYYTAGDYYAKGATDAAQSQELPGRWRGIGARMLGLEGAIARRDWDLLCDNRDPRDGSTLTARRKAVRRVGYDVNFHAPKSLSLLYGLARDPRLLEAFEDAVDATMHEIEAQAQARVRSGGRNEDRTTGAMVWGRFTHLTARPVDGTPDPHLHSHCFVFNATPTPNPHDPHPHDPHPHEPNEPNPHEPNLNDPSLQQPSTGRWKALQLGSVKRDAPYFEAVFHSVLARRIEELGLATRRTASGWELQGVDDAALARFSRRTRQIEDLARQRGITDPKLKAELGARTRSSKAADLTMDQLRSVWDQRLDDAQRGAIAGLARAIGSRPLPEHADAARHAVTRAVEHCFERASVVPTRTLLAESLRQGLGRASRTTIESLTLARDLIHAARDQRDYVTTKDVLDEERAMLTLARDGRGACSPIVPGAAREDNHATLDHPTMRHHPTMQDNLATHDAPTQGVHPLELRRPWLNDQQQRAVRHVLGSRDRVMIVRGVAGAGKTSALQEVREQAERAGVAVHAFAPSSSASRGVLRDEGFRDADTLAALLANPALQERISGGLVIVDEAGLVGTRAMRSLLELAVDRGARVVLVGDRRQHGPVERGGALGLLEDHAGLRPARITAIQRQRERYKHAIEDLSAGRAGRGLATLRSLGWIRQIDDEHRDAALASAYADSVQSKASTLVVSPTHAEGQRITDAIRSELRRRGLLAREETHVTRLVPRGLTLGQKRDPTSYEPGDVLVFHQNARGHRKGQRLVVGDDPAFLPLDQANRFSVYRPDTLTLAQGDHVRVTASGRSLDDKPLRTGDIYRVAGLSKSGDITLVGIDQSKPIPPRVLPREFGHIAHGFVVTSHASQGRTVDRVIIGQSSRSFGASSMEQFYVSASRGRHQALVFTDDTNELLQAVQRNDERTSATELLSRQQHRIARQQAQAHLQGHDATNAGDRAPAYGAPSAASAPGHPFLVAAPKQHTHHPREGIDHER